MFFESDVGLGPEDEPQDSEDAYEPLDTVDITESDHGPDVEADDR